MKTGTKVLVVAAGLTVSALFFLLAAASGMFLQRRAGPGSGRIALVNIEGGIFDSRETIDLIRRYGDNRRISAIVVRIDSPGGGIAPVQEIYRELEKIRSRGEKPVVASLGSVAASGGYYIACAADKIFANPGTVTGSIGVIISALSMEELLGRIGLGFTTVKSGEYKDTGSSVRKMTPEEKAYLQGLVDNMHRQFVEVVKSRRGLDEARSAEVSDGRVFSGEQALELDLVDELGTLYDAIGAAAGLAGVDRWTVTEERKRRSLWRIIFGSAVGGRAGAAAPLYLWEGVR